MLFSGKMSKNSFLIEDILGNLSGGVRNVTKSTTDMIPIKKRTLFEANQVLDHSKQQQLPTNGVLQNTEFQNSMYFLMNQVNNQSNGSTENSSILMSSLLQSLYSQNHPINNNKNVENYQQQLLNDYYMKLLSYSSNQIPAQGDHDQFNSKRFKSASSPVEHNKSLHLNKKTHLQSPNECGKISSYKTKSFSNSSASSTASSSSLFSNELFNSSPRSLVSNLDDSVSPLDALLHLANTTFTSGSHMSQQSLKAEYVSDEAALLGKKANRNAFLIEENKLQSKYHNLNLI